MFGFAQRILPVFAMSLLVVAYVWGETASKVFSQADLLGHWEFVSWMEEGDESSKRKINILMEFKGDGTVLSQTKNGVEESRYSIHGDTIHYTDKRGEQRWRIMSFERNKMLKVNNLGAVMLLEKR